MIARVTIRRFKKFQEVTFELNGHIVLAGPNNSGKTTVLQAIAAFGLALYQWKTLNNYQRRGGGYELKPIARQAFAAVPLRSYDLLWTDRGYRGDIEVEITLSNGRNLTLEFRPDSTEQVYVRPKAIHEPELVRDFQLYPTYVPPMSGLETEEPVYTRAKQDDLLGKRKPGDILRNLLVSAHETQDAWGDLQQSVGRLFGYELAPPNSQGPHIIAEYRVTGSPVTFDIASAGSGFQQVLMLLAFLFTRHGSVLLLDEPDAHLHVILQDAIYGELRAVAARWGSQLIVATHSEVVINSVAPDELYVLLNEPRRLSTIAERKILVNALRVLPQTDITLACETPGIIYVEGHTDLSLLREWARILNHPSYPFLSVRTFWRPTVWQTRDDAPGIRALEHFQALQLVRPDIPGLMLIDGDAQPPISATPITGQGLQRQRWLRYEAESYLLHPIALERFVEQMVGAEAADLAKSDLRGYFEAQFGKELTADFYANPLSPKPLIEKYLQQTKARTDVLPPALNAAGILALPHTRYHEIAALMQPDEIHPEVIEKLNAIQQALRL